MDLWREHVREYQVLAQREGKCGPVFIIDNEGSPEEALAQIISCADQCGPVKGSK